jgi:outer membrane protein assembly factor BamB
VTLSRKLCGVGVWTLGLGVFVTLVGSNVSHAQGAGSPWPMFRGDREHSGRSEFSAATNQGALKWRFTFAKMPLRDLISDLASEPVVGSDGTIYAASIDDRPRTHTLSGHLFALSPDGKQKWQFDAADFLSAGEEGETSPAIGADGTIYVGGREMSVDIATREEHGDRNSLGFLYAINPNGTLKWKFATGTKADFSSSPMIGGDGAIYFGSGGGNLYAINQDGKLRWKCAVGHMRLFSPAIGSDGTIYVDSNVDPDLGDSKGDSDLSAVAPSGAIKWKFKGDDLLTSSPTIGSDDTIYVSVVHLTDEKTAGLCAINRNGRLKWEFTAKKAYSFSNPAIGADGAVYVYSGDRSLYAVNSSGTLKWRSASFGSKTIGASPTIAGDGTIFVGANALDVNGVMKWKYDEHMSGTAAIGADGTIYFECGDRADICAIGPAASATQH